MAWVVFLIIIVIAVIITVANINKKKQLQAEGKTIHRDVGFWSNKELFTTAATYDQVKTCVKNNSFDGCPVSMQYNVNGKQSIVFHSGTWNAELDCLETQGDKNVFRFCFTTWDARHGYPYGENSMNILMTTIEKIFLALDPATTVETRRMEVSTKSKFF